MKLFNNIYGEHTEKVFPDHPLVPLERRDPTQSRNTILANPLRDIDTLPPPIGDPLRFDMIDDELEDPDSAFGDPQETEMDFENVDVQAILFYGHSGRRCFPSVKAL
jgi:hypothetical protein